MTESVVRIGGIPDPHFGGELIDLGPTHPGSAGMLDVRISTTGVAIASAMTV